MGLCLHQHTINYLIEVSSFEDDGTMIVSPWLSPMNQKRLDIFNGKKIRTLPTEGREDYLLYHREFVFKK